MNKNILITTSNKQEVNGIIIWIAGIHKLTSFKLKS